MALRLSLKKKLIDILRAFLERVSAIPRSKLTKKHSFGVVSGAKKSRFFHSRGGKICILAKNDLWQSQDRF